ncbi:MAG: MFS transporter [Thermodesulfobacteriota bacterium]
MTDQPKKASIWSPLRQSLFRALWIAAIASNIGAWMQDVGAAWYMTTLAPTPVMVALVQVASRLPMFLFALPAGALADVVDRRRLLLITQSWMLTAAAILGVLTLAGVTTPWILLTFTFLLGLGAALSGPAWQAIVPELVPQSDMPSAVALNSVGINISRAVGPALGGIIISLSSPGVVFILNAVTFVGVLIVLYKWRRTPVERALPTERFFGAMKAGVRYVRRSPDLRAVFVRTGIFIFFGSVLWALLPLVAKNDLRSGPAGYGILLGFFGTGAVIGATLLSRLKSRFSLDTLVTGATIIFAATIFALAFTHIFAIVCALMVLGGACWLSLLSSFNVAAQAGAPSWVRARALSVYLLFLFGGLAMGSAFWGILANHVGISMALIIAAFGMIGGIFIRGRYHLISGEGLDLTPSMHWPAPKVVEETDLRYDQGPVLVMVEFRILPEKAHEFSNIMNKVSKTRLRDGAIRWNLFRDTADPGRFVETFIVESWIEHLRQHERVTVSDRYLLKEAEGYHIGDEPPVVSHLIANN